MVHLTGLRVRPGEKALGQGRAGPDLGAWPLGEAAGKPVGRPPRALAARQERRRASCTLCPTRVRVRAGGVCLWGMSLQGSLCSISMGWRACATGFISIPGQLRLGSQALGAHAHEHLCAHTRAASTSGAKLLGAHERQGPCAHPWAARRRRRAPGRPPRPAARPALGRGRRSAGRLPPRPVAARPAAPAARAPGSARPRGLLPCAPAPPARDDQLSALAGHLHPHTLRGLQRLVNLVSAVKIWHQGARC